LTQNDFGSKIGANLSKAMVEKSKLNTIAVGISISSTKIDLVELDADGNLASSRTSSLAIERSIVDQIHELIIEHDSKFDVLGVAVPGLIESPTGLVVSSRIQQLVGLNFGSELAEIAAGGLVIENDANAAAYAEFEIGEGKGSRNMFFVVLGDGVGSGLILEGTLWRGSAGFAGEFGSIVVEDEGTRLEEVASVPNIVRRTRNRFHQDSTSILSRMNEDEIELSDLMAASAEGDDFARLMLERTGTYVGSALSSVINVLNVDKIVIGGEAVRSDDVILDAIVKRAGECSSPHTFAAVEISVSVLDEYASAIGAALIARGG
jgi:glucokinase